MKKVIVISKQGCTGCSSLKLFMKAALRGKYDDNVENITLEDNAKEYAEWVEKVNTAQVPTLILVEGEEVLEVQKGFEAPKVKELFEKNFNEESLLEVVKRDGTVVAFDITKIELAVQRASDRIEYEIDAKAIAKEVKEGLKGSKVEVETIQDTVENVLVKNNNIPVARAYISYREARRKERSRSLFKKRLELKPYEYPEMVDYKEAIQHSYWLVSEFNFTSDIQDYLVKVTDAERGAIKNSMLAIAQVEVAVKSFWGDLYKRMPKPEIGAVGSVYAESEVRHMDAYSHLLEILGLNKEFDNIKNIPALNNRVEYLENSTATVNSLDNREFVISLIYFSLFIEHVSLFSQFLIMMSFNKHQNLFKGVSNVIEATSKEEQIHGLFGIELVNIIRKEHPEWFDKDLEDKIYKASLQAYDAEEQVLDWIYEAGDLEFMPKATVKEFVKHRLNNSLADIGYERIFEEDKEAVDSTMWFDEEILTTKHLDFFVKRSTNYTKRAQSITVDDLF